MIERGLFTILRMTPEGYAGKSVRVRGSSSRNAMRRNNTPHCRLLKKLSGEVVRRRL